MAASKLIQALLQQGVNIPHPESVFVAPSVVAGRIAPGVVIYPGCRLAGEETSLGPGCALGAEGPVTLTNCQCDAKVSLAGGSFAEATFLDGASLGSLVNFCDCLMAGGADRRRHSEVGSAYVHFNYTPHRDKTTASLLGDVPRGVMLDQPPIFLGGQGGLVGPARVAYGTVVPAGTILRKDALEGGLVAPPPAPARSDPHYQQGAYQAINRIVANNLIYIGNIVALRAWYRQVRFRLMQPDPFRVACHAGALRRLETVLKERIYRLKELVENMPCSLELARAGGGANAAVRAQQQVLIDRWPSISLRLAELDRVAGAPAAREMLLAELGHVPAGAGYLETIKSLSVRARQSGTAWLQSMVDEIAGIWQPIPG